jgi:hypothetical protein
VQPAVVTLGTVREVQVTPSVEVYIAAVFSATATNIPLPNSTVISRPVRRDVHVTPSVDDHKPFVDPDSLRVATNTPLPNATSVKYAPETVVVEPDIEISPDTPLDAPVPAAFTAATRK